MKTLWSAILSPRTFRSSEVTLYNQGLRTKTIYSKLTEYKKHCATLKQKFIETGYEENILKDQIDKVDNTDRQDLLRKKEKSNKGRISCLITYNQTLPMMRKIINNIGMFFK